MALTVLLTGFGPFPTAPVNPTGPLVERLAARRRPAFASMRRITHIFRTSYAAVDEELPDLVARHRPDALVMFGLAPRTPHLRIETRARNVRTGLLPDADGASGNRGPILARGPAALTGRAPFQQLLAAARSADVPAALSADAGTYLCNYLYWRALQPDGEARIPLVVFVHVPKLGDGKIRRAGATRRRLAFADFVRAGEALLTALAPHLRRRR